MTEPVPGKKKIRWRRWALGCGGAVLVVILAVVLTGWYLYHLFQSDPRGWEQAQQVRTQTTVKQRAVIAEAMENRLLTELSFADHFDDHGRPIPNTSDTRTIKLTTDEINAWLDQRLPKWLRNRRVKMPDQLRDPTFWIADERIMMGAQVSYQDMERVVSFGFEIDAPEDADEATLRMTGAWVGELRVPLEEILDPIQAQMRESERDEEAQALGRLPDGLTFSPFLEGGGEHVRLIAVRPVEGELHIVLRKLKP